MEFPAPNYHHFESFMVITSTCLAVTEYKCHNDHGYVQFVVITMPSPNPLSCMTYHRIYNKSNMAGSTIGTGTVYTAGRHRFTFGFYWNQHWSFRTITSLYNFSFVLWWPLRFPLKTLYSFCFYSTPIYVVGGFMFYLCCFFLFTYNSVISKMGTAYLSEALDFIYCF